MEIDVKKLEAPCGAIVQGFDLNAHLSSGQAKLIREAWLKHHVLVFPEQKLSDDKLEEFSLCFGEFGENPTLNQSRDANTSTQLNEKRGRNPQYSLTHCTPTGAL